MAKKKKERKETEAGDGKGDLTLMEYNISDAKLLRITKTEYRGKQGLDIREFYDATNGEGDKPDWRHSKKGIRIAEDTWEPFFKAMKKASRLLISS